MQYTQSELAKLIETVETEFSGFLAKSETAASAVAPLAKAEDAKPEDKKDEKPSEKKDEKPKEKEDKAEEKRGEEKPDATPEHKEEDAPKGEAEPKAPAAAEGQEAGQEHHGYDEEDMEHMHKMYASMSKAELKAHHDAIMKCGAAAQPAAQPAGDMPMAKSETVQPTEVKVETQPETALLKSELETTKAQNEELKKNLDGIKEFLTKLVKTVPQGKAITSLDVVAKSETAQEPKELSKSEISQKLSQKAADPTLTKSDREAINNYYLNGANLNTISHLLK